MAFDGDGSFTRPVADYVFDTVISETDMNTEMDGIATGLSNVICRDGQTDPTANLPMASFRHTGVGNASARGHYAATGQVQDSGFIWCGTATGTKNALALSPSPAITAYAAGQKFRFKAGATASDAAVTINVSSVDNKDAEIDDAALSASAVIEANKYYEALYDGTAFQLTRLSLAVTAAGQAVVGAATAAAQRTALGIVIGTDVLAPSGDGSSLTGISYDMAFVAGYDSSMVKEDVAVQTYGKLDVGRAGSFTGEVSSIETAPTGAALILDVEKNGVTIYTTKPQFAATATSLTPGVLKADGTEDFVAGDTITFKITQVGSTEPGEGVTFTALAQVT